MSTQHTHFDGHKHWWKDGWICEKCSLHKADYIKKGEIMKTKKTETSSLNVRNFPDDSKEKLKKLAEKNSRSFSNYVRLVLIEHANNTKL